MKIDILYEGANGGASSHFSLHNLMAKVMISATTRYYYFLLSVMWARICHFFSNFFDRIRLELEKDILFASIMIFMVKIYYRYLIDTI